MALTIAATPAPGGPEATPTRTCRSADPAPVDARTWLVWDMKISEVIKKKGRDVVTIGSGTTVAEMLRILDEHRIGALVVSDDGGVTVAGIASERDVVRALHQRGVGVLQEAVRSIMTSEVWTCVSDDELETLAVSMTEHRVRHLPVVDDDRLVAIVSIGDVVKHRLDELQAERNQLFDYVQGDRSAT